VLAIVGFWFTAQQDARLQRNEDDRAQQAQKIENQRAEAERELAEQRAQDEALQAYLDQISTLLLEKDLLNARGHDAVQTLAEARTLTILDRLDRAGRTQVIRFLHDAGLVQQRTPGSPAIWLWNANLQGVDLNFTDDQGITIQTNVTFTGADLRGAELYGADLRYADLSYTTLDGVYLGRANLSHANFGGADLRGSDLSGAKLHRANLSSVNLSDANLSAADLSASNLGDANLREADLTNANLSDANLRQADLTGAIDDASFLGDANNPSDANVGPTIKVPEDGKPKLLTNKELDAQATNLKGATMPNGQKYEDWLKSKGGGEDGENGGPA